MDGGRIVRLPIAVEDRPSRRWEERLALRFPRATASLARVVQRLPVRSRLRLLVVRRAFQLATEALNRRDYAVAFGLTYHPDVEFDAAQLDTLGMKGTKGREERIRFQQRWNEDWGEFRFAPEEFIAMLSERGEDRVVVVGRIHGAGLTSGAAFDNEWGVIVTLSQGLVAREQAFFNRAQTLNAAGLSE
jgi:ketosteroid isomerase-like protein